MGLAANIDNEIIKSVNVNFTEIINLSKYRDCKEFVSLVNDISLYTSTLVMLEVDDEARDYFFQGNNFNIFYETNQSLINDVKNYPNKKLKKKYLKIDKNELEAFKFLKIRYEQILKNEYCHKFKFLEAKSTDTPKKHSQMNMGEMAAFLLGALYDSIAEENADFLSPFVKEKIKTAYSIARYRMPDICVVGSFERNVEKILTSHKRAFDVLAK